MYPHYFVTLVNQWRIFFQTLNDVAMFFFLFHFIGILPREIILK